MSSTYEISPELAGLLEHYKDREEDSADLNELEATCVRQSVSSIRFGLESVEDFLSSSIENLVREGKTHGTTSLLRVALDSVHRSQSRVKDIEFILDREYAQRIQDAQMNEDAPAAAPTQGTGIQEGGREA